MDLPLRDAAGMEKLPVGSGSRDPGVTVRGVASRVELGGGVIVGYLERKMVEFLYAPQCEIA